MDEHRRVVPTGLLDAHHHVWDLAVRDQPWTTQVPVLRRTFTANQLASHLEAAGVAATIVVQTVNSPDETAELLAAAADTPWMFGVVGWADLTSLGLADELACLRSMPGGDLLVGLVHQVHEESDPGWLCRGDVRRGLQVVAGSSQAYDHIVQAEQWPATISTVRALPQLRFVLDHLANPPMVAGALSVDESWLAAVRALAAAPNVTFKLSGLVTRSYPKAATIPDLEPYVRALSDLVGPERILFGSDWPVCTAVTDDAGVMGTALRLIERFGPDAQGQVFRRSATTVYR